MVTTFPTSDNQTDGHTGQMFEGFSARARQVIELARERARDLHEDTVGTEHLLLGLIADEHRSTSDDAPTPLIDTGLDERATDDHARRVRSGPRPADTRTAQQIGNRLRGGDLGFTERATKALELSLRASLQTSRPRGAPRPPITPTHLLLGLLDQPDNGALRVLLAFNVNIPALRQRASAVATDTPADASSPGPSRDSAAFAAAMQPPSTPVEPTIMAWLQDTLYGSHLRPEYLGVLNTLAMAGRDHRLDIAPDEVLVSWHRELARLRMTRLQSELGFLDAAARAGWTDAAIAHALATPPERTVAEHRALLEAEQEHYHPSHHPHPWTG